MTVSAQAEPMVESRSGSSAQQIERVPIISVGVPQSFLTRSVLFQPSPFSSHFSLTYHQEDRQTDKKITLPVTAFRI